MFSPQSYGRLISKQLSDIILKDVTEKDIDEIAKDFDLNCITLNQVVRRQHSMTMEYSYAVLACINRSYQKRIESKKLTFKQKLKKLWK